MRSKKYYAQNAAIIILAIAIIFMSVGYAVFSTQLELNGVTRIESSKWSVLFQNPTKYSSTTITDDKISKFELTDTTSVSFDATLGLNDTFSFVVDVVNDGTFDAKLTSWTLTAKKNDTNESVGISEDGTSYTNGYLTYSVKWLYGNALAENEILPHRVTGSTDNVKKLLVTIQTHAPENPADAPLEGDTFGFDFSMNYGTNM